MRISPTRFFSQLKELDQISEKQFPCHRRDSVSYNTKCSSPNVSNNEMSKYFCIAIRLQGTHISVSTVVLLTV